MLLKNVENLPFSNNLDGGLRLKLWIQRASYSPYKKDLLFKFFIFGLRAEK